MDAPTGTPLQDDRYLLLAAIGRGGMASVYRAFDRVDQRVVALKVLYRNPEPGPAHPLCQEFDAWSRMSHPNIVKVYELGVARRGPIRRDTPYLVLEHVGGGPAHRALEPGRISAGQLERVTVSILRALAHVHRCGMVHRDLKPGNVLVERGRRLAVKLTDFGLAARAGLSEQPGVISGSLPYVAPEGLLGLPLDGRADLYGLGVLLYQLATGQTPVPGGSVDEVLQWHLAGSPADPRQLRPGLPDRLGRFVRRLTARSRDDRPSDARDALAMLGARPSRSSRRAPSPADAEREVRTTLRLALDAARLGDLREYTLPPQATSRRRELLREVTVWTRLHQLAYLEVSASEEDGRELGRIVLRLLFDRPGEAAWLTRRFALDRFLPLRVVGGFPVWDEQRTTEAIVRSGMLKQAASLSRFLLDCAKRRTLVLHVAGRAHEGGLLSELLPTLRRQLDQRRPAAANRGGLLLILDAVQNGCH